MKPFNRRVIAAVSTLLLGLAPGVADASGKGAGSSFESFGAYLDRVSGARFGGQGAVRDEATFNEMRKHILDQYDGVEVRSSFVDGESYFDCVVTETQPSLRATGEKQIASAPELSSAPSTTSAGRGATQYADGQADQFGNAMVCPAGTIPMQRLSLERMTTFPTLDAYLAKRPGSSSAATRVQAGYAVGRQVVNNHGGNAVLNLWNPTGYYTLAEQWVIGSGQTAEAGWVHYPNKFGASSVLFIFYTPDNYLNACYNLECGTFVQTSNVYTLGGRFTTYSVRGGNQIELAVQWKYYQGNWWLFIGTTSVGYYPGAVYGSGPMRSGNAIQTDFGGEALNPEGSLGSWPQMGSGLYPNSGYSLAAYQRNIFYIDQSDVSHWSVLTPSAGRPNCYLINITGSAAGGSWGTYHYFGGPGGPTSFC